MLFLFVSFLGLLARRVALPRIHGSIFFDKTKGLFSLRLCCILVYDICVYNRTVLLCVFPFPLPSPIRTKTEPNQVFRWHIGAVQLLLKDGVGFLCTSKMPTPLHKMFGLDSLTYYIQAVGGFFIILM